MLTAQILQLRDHFQMRRVSAVAAPADLRYVIDFMTFGYLAPVSYDCRTMHQMFRRIGGLKMRIAVLVDRAPGRIRAPALVRLALDDDCLKFCPPGPPVHRTRLTLCHVGLP